MKAVPLAVVGMGYRDGPTALRAKLIQLDEGAESPSAALLKSGAAAGIVRLHTCSRAEWIISAENPGWAAQLLRSSLLTRVGPEAKGRDLHLKAGHAAVHYLTRVTLGLEAVAEGEQAVGRQVLKAFEDARKNELTDRVLHSAWKALSQVLHKRRDELPAHAGHGVQALVVAALQLGEVEKTGPILLYGMGEMGRATARALKRAGYENLEGFGRATESEFLAAAKKARAVVVASGAPQPHLQLPKRIEQPLAIDVGSPPQIASAPGWELQGLDVLLTNGQTGLPEAELSRLQALCESTTHDLVRALEQPLPAQALEAIDAERRAFMNDTLPSLIAGLPPDEAKKLKSQMQKFAHQLIKRTRGDDT